MKYVIVDAWGRFWSGRRWVPEYPDAMEFKRPSSAVIEARMAIATGDTPWVDVVSEYGFANQTAVRFERAQL